MIKTNVLNIAPNKIKIYSTIMVSVLFVLLTLVYYYFHNIGMDWHFFREAFFELIAFRSPFNVQGYFNPPWVLPILAPLLILPERLGSSIVSALSLIGIAFLCYKQGAKPLVILAILFSPAVILEARCANITWLVALGLLLPPKWGLLIVLIKPQVGVGIAIYWIIEAWRNGRLRAVINLIAPTTAAFLISILLFGLWPLNFRNAIATPWNFSHWEIFLPIGLMLLITALRNRKPQLAIVCSPMLSPYISLHAWLISLIGLSSDILFTLIAVIGLWIIFLIK
jgi:hypothetical protein